MPPIRCVALKLFFRTAGTLTRKSEAIHAIELGQTIKICLARQMRVRMSKNGFRCLLRELYSCRFSYCHANVDSQ